MNHHLLFDVLGWIGAAALLLAYAAVSFKKLAGDAVTYQLLNIAGSILLAANTTAYRAYPSSFVNLVWIGIAIFSVTTRKRKRSARAKR